MRDSGADNTRADHQADRRHHRAFAENHAEDRPRLGAERHADAKLVGALADRKRQHAADADHRDGEREQREQSDQRRVQPLRRDRLVTQLLERLHVIDRADSDRASGSSRRPVA